MASIEIRKLDAEHWATWRDLRLRALADSPDAFGETFAVASRRPDDEWMQAMVPGNGEHRLVATSNGEPIGMCFVRFDGHDAGLYAMWVDADHRGQGCGEMLLHRAIAIARQQGSRALRLRVTATNAGPRRLYRSNGFVETGEVTPLRAGDSVETVTMVLDLN